MAAELTGTTPSLIQSTSTGSVTTTLTVPADADAIIVMAVGYGSGSNLWTATTMTFAGNALTEVTGATYTAEGAFLEAGSSSGHVAIWSGDESTWGSTEDLVFNWDAAVGEGVSVQAVFVKNVDTITVKDSDTGGVNGDITGMTSAADDLTLGCAYAYQQAPTMTDNGQTEIVANGVYNNAGYGFAYKANSATFDISNTNFSRCCAVVIDGVAAGGRTTKNTRAMHLGMNVGMNHRSAF